METATTRRWSKGTLKKKALEEFCRFIRVRDANMNGMCKCITCEACKFFTEIDGGHFRGGNVNAVCFDPLFCYAQCRQCNHFKGGNQAVYREVLINLHGISVVEDFDYRWSNARLQLTRDDLLGIKEHWRDQWKLEIKNKGLIKPPSW
jgi:hypothetical protein